jgi:hypothetical protein
LATPWQLVIKRTMETADDMQTARRRDRDAAIHHLKT